MASPQAPVPRQIVEQTVSQAFIEAVSIEGIGDKVGIDGQAISDERVLSSLARGSGFEDF